jgi:Ca2+-binding RTX toxin-like protein
MTGGAGNDVYITSSASDVIVEAAGGGNDTVQTTGSYNLGAELENVRIMTDGAINVIGNTLNNYLYAGGGDNVLNGSTGSDTVSYIFAGAAVSVNLGLAGAQATGGSGNDSYVSIESVVGSNFADTLTGSTLANFIDGAQGADMLAGGAGADNFVFNNLLGSDTITDFVSGSDKLRIGQAGIAVGDGDTVVEGAVTLAGPGGFANSAEYVVVTADIAGSITTASAAARIGSATSSYAIGRKALFMVDNGSTSALYLFTAADADAAVEANELTLLATLTGTASTTGDLVFGG